MCSFIVIKRYYCKINLLRGVIGKIDIGTCPINHSIFSRYLSILIIGVTAYCYHLLCDIYLGHLPKIDQVVQLFRGIYAHP